MVVPLPSLPCCVVYYYVLEIGGDIPNGKGRKRCPNHHCMRSSGPKCTSTMNSISMGTQSSVSLEETNQPSPTGWASTLLLLFLDKQDPRDTQRGLSKRAE